MQASSPFTSYLLTYLASHWSMLLLLCGGIAYSIFKFNTAKSPAILTAMGLSVVLLVDLLTIGVSAFFLRSMTQDSSVDRSRWTVLMTIVNVFTSLVRTAGWGAVIAAVFVGRSDSSYSKGPQK